MTNNKTIIVLNITWIKSKAWGQNPKCSGQRFNNDNTSSYFKLNRSISGCGYDKLNTAKANVLNELLMIEELKQAQSLKCYGVSQSSTPRIDGACGTVDNIMRDIGYTVYTCDDSITYIKE